MEFAHRTPAEHPIPPMVLHLSPVKHAIPSMMLHHASVKHAIPPMMLHHASVKHAIPPMMLHHAPVKHAIPPMMLHHASVKRAIPPVTRARPSCAPSRRTRTALRDRSHRRSRPRQGRFVVPPASGSPRRTDRRSRKRTHRGRPRLTGDPDGSTAAPTGRGSTRTGRIRSCSFAAAPAAKGAPPPGIPSEPSPRGQ